MRFLLGFSFALRAIWAADGPALAVDASAARHPISPDIYGINDYQNAGLSALYPVGLTRWGGDGATRYSRT